MNKDSTLYKVVLLGVLCAVCGLLLSIVNNVTTPVINANALKAELENLRSIYPDSTTDNTKEYDEGKDFTSDMVQKYFVVDGEGTVYKVKATGYNSNGFTFMIAFDQDGNVSGFTAVEQNESPGFGVRCFTEQGYLDQINSITVNDQAPLLSGATLTSTAIQQGVDAAEQLWKAGNK